MYILYILTHILTSIRFANDFYVGGLSEACRSLVLHQCIQLFPLPPPLKAPVSVHPLSSPSSTWFPCPPFNIIHQTLHPPASPSPLTGWFCAVPGSGLLSEKTLNICLVQVEYTLKCKRMSLLSANKLWSTREWARHIDSCWLLSTAGETRVHWAPDLKRQLYGWTRRLRLEIAQIPETFTECDQYLMWPFGQK